MKGTEITAEDQFPGPPEAFKLYTELPFHKSDNKMNCFRQAKVIIFCQVDCKGIFNCRQREFVIVPVDRTSFFVVSILVYQQDHISDIED